MKKIYYLLSLIILFVFPQTVASQEYGKIRAFTQRAASVIKQKNNFIAKVLQAYAVPYEQNAQGAVIRINRDGQWLDVISVEIIPVPKEGSDNQVSAHELLFYTKNGILDLVSDMTIR